MNFLPSPKAFLGLDSKDMVDSQKVKAIIVPFGLENSVSYQGGTSFGPQAIIKASHEVELFDEYFWKEPFRDFGIATLEEPKISQNLPQALRQLENITEEILQQNKFPMILGGEHSITAGSIRPFAKRFKDLVILHFDAHADLRDGYQGEHYSHASAMRRCLDDKEVYNNGSHIELISFGIRNISVSEIPFLEQNSHRIHLNFAKDKKNWNLDKILLSLKDRPIYLTFDVDGFDASLMPATGTPEPGGLFWDDAIEIIQKASNLGNIIGADVNELSPIANFHSCDFIVAKLVYKILSFKFSTKCK